jgi:hypothetical protein
MNGFAPAKRGIFPGYSVRVNSVNTIRDVRSTCTGWRGHESRQREPAFALIWLSAGASFPANGSHGDAAGEQEWHPTTSAE